MKRLQAILICFALLGFVSILLSIWNRKKESDSSNRPLSLPTKSQLKNRADPECGLSRIERLTKSGVVITANHLKKQEALGEVKIVFPDGSELVGDELFLNAAEDAYVLSGAVVANVEGLTLSSTDDDSFFVFRPNHTSSGLVLIDSSERWTCDDGNNSFVVYGSLRLHLQAWKNGARTLKIRPILPQI